MKILLSAFACRPGQGSEPGVGWNAAWHLAQRHRVHVLTSARQRDDILDHLSRHPCPNLSFSFHDPAWAGSLRDPTSFLWNFYYLWWQMRIVAWARSEIADFAPDVVHHVTYVRYWMPSALARLPHPFVFGPVGGGDESPPALRSSLPFKSRLKDLARRIVRRGFELHPGVKRTLKSAAVVVANTPASLARAKVLGARRTELMSEAALKDEDLDALYRKTDEAMDAKAPVFVTSARLLHWKGVNLSIQALCDSRLKDSVLEVFGDGPDREWLEALAKRAGVADRVRFNGRVDRSIVIERLANATALVHPSLHDSGGWVCLEAMAAGVPVVCLDVGGPATQVTGETGIAVKPVSVAGTVQLLADAMHRLAANHDLRRKMGGAGQRRVAEHYTWEKRVADFEELYRKAINNHRQDSFCSELAVTNDALTADPLA